jgi:hypothetical protein
VLSAGIDPDLGVPWIAMELLRGATLAEHVERHGPMRAADCLEVMVQTRHGLQMAHARNLVHRDIKPDNIFVAHARRVGVPFTIKVLDFGIAKWVHDVRDRDQNSQVIGTPLWMAPEQLSNVALIAPATDVWALGLLAFWMLTGHEYWLTANDDRSTVSAMLLELVGGVKEPASARAARLGVGLTLPSGFDAWFARAVHLDAKARFSDAATCIDALAPLLSGVSASRDDVHREQDAQRHAAHADTAALSSRSPTTQTSRTARRLHTADLSGALFAGTNAARAFFPLAELLTEGLATSPTPTDGARETSRGLPDVVQEAVRHVCLVLGVHPAAKPVQVADDTATFTVVSVAPPVIGVPLALLASTSPSQLRAHAAVAVARALPSFGVLAVLRSDIELESARKAAVALARGTVSTSPYFRRLMAKLGPRRTELADACEVASAVTASTFWTSASFTVAKLALLCSSDRDASVAAVHAAGLGIDADVVEAHLDVFIASDAYESYWHQRG